VLPGSGMVVASAVVVVIVLLPVVARDWLIVDCVSPVLQWEIIPYCTLY